MIRRPLPGFLLNFLLASVLAAAASGCAGARALDCRLEGGAGVWQSGGYSVTVLLRNSSEHPLELDQIVFEITILDADDRVLVEAFPTRFPGRQVPPLEIAHLSIPIPRRLDRPAAGGGTYRALVALRDRQGNLLSQVTIDRTSIQDDLPAPPAVP